MTDLIEKVAREIDANVEIDLLDMPRGGPWVSNTDELAQVAIATVLREMMEDGAAQEYSDINAWKFLRMFAHDHGIHIGGDDA